MERTGREAIEKLEKLEQEGGWKPPPLPEAIPQGDMPGDIVHIGESHVLKANRLFPELRKALPGLLRENPHQKAVVAVCGGSGVGKSETASLLAFYLRQAGVGSYVLSGDNYPRRIPRQNDAERLRVFRASGVRGLVANGQYTPERGAALRGLQQEQRDADPALAREHPWLAVYQREGRKGLGAYLGSPQEIDFDEVTGIVAQFKNGADVLFLKRMGREEEALWYEPVDFRGVQVLVMEWTHGNSPRFQGVDYPILLSSTPQETLAYRKSRHRDGSVDSPFTTMVLELEQRQLEAQAPQARLILSKDGELLSYAAYSARMAAREGE